MKQHRGIATIVAALGAGGVFPYVLAVLLPALACSTKTVTAAAPPDDAGATPHCDPAKCAPGNECISDGTETKCRLVCEIKPDGTGGQSSCPGSYTCLLPVPTPNAMATIQKSDLGAMCAYGCEPDSLCASKDATCTGQVCVFDGRPGAVNAYCSADCTSTECPDGYTCEAAKHRDGKVCVAAAPIKAFCAPDKTTYAKSDKGQWGASCPAPGGFDKNPACDSEQNFWCYGTSPVDGNAFCTQFDCTENADCRGGWWCATMNDAPNVVNKARSTGKTRRVCLPRTYCSPCAQDIDCPSIKGIRQHCTADEMGGKLCAPECTIDSNCNNEAKCAMSDTAGTKVCQPRAGVCKGDGSLCAPCFSDADCPDGTCAGSQYSTEHYCTVKSKVPCTTDGMTLTASDCPKTNAAKVPVSCATTAFGPDPSIGKDQCFGLVSFGTGTNLAKVPGCFTPAR